MQHSSIIFKGNIFKTIKMNNINYINADILIALEDAIREEETRDLGVGDRFYDRVEDLLSQGYTLHSMRHSNFPDIKRNTYYSLMHNIKKLSLNKEGTCNTKLLIKKVTRGSNFRLLAIILP